MTETELQNGLIQAARSLGFLCYHTSDSRRNEPGFPDLLIVGHGKAFAFECKGKRGKLRMPSVTKRGRVLPGQADWLDALYAAGIPSFVVRPTEATDAIGYDRALELLRTV